MDHELNAGPSICFKEDIINDPFEIFNSKWSPKSDDVFKYKAHSFGDKLMEIKQRTCITQKSIERDHCQNDDRKVISSKQIDIQEAPNVLAVKEVEQKQDDFENKIIALQKNTNCDESSKVVRRDVINKTIFRIIRRFFYSLLEQLIPDYKQQKRANLLNMLVRFAQVLFPEEQDIIEVSEVL